MDSLFLMDSLFPLYNTICVWLQAAAVSPSASVSQPETPALAALAASQLPQLTAAAASATMMLQWQLLPPPQSLPIGLLQAAVASSMVMAQQPQQLQQSAHTSRPAAVAAVAPQPCGGADATAATGTARGQHHHGQQLRQREQAHVKVCRPTARLAERTASSGSAGSQRPDSGEQVASPPSGGAGLQQSAHSAFRALVSA